eukprot:TRINITY_DN3900_c0_g1_i1.p1 TRINITY_DN3900_c0_g1~~TRINITY_DN3900_c0_g1_i1.p1  ORF type:complete len:246 (+),score=46.28 TRINITY_DN3900_c0_g1_i1:3-740(+)
MTEPRACQKKRRKIDHVIENHSQLPYICDWLNQPFFPSLLQDPNFFSFINSHSIKKELSESFALYSKLEPLLKKYPDPSQVVLFDVCSGKGFLSCLLSFLYPSTQIYMIDKDTKINLTHLKSLPNVTMKTFDILKNFKLFQEWVNVTVENKTGILLGSHLCGELSENVIKLYNDGLNVKHLILVPCCISKTRKEQTTTVAKRLNVDNYKYWCLYLYHLITIQSRRDLCEDEYILSPKNTFLLASK